MQIKQVKDFINSISQQAYGETAVTATDLTGLIAMGNAVLSSAANVDAFTKALIDRIGLTIFERRAYKGAYGSVMMDTFVYGCVMQKLLVMPSEAETANQWTLTDGQSVDQYKVKVPVVRQKLFTGRTAWQYRLTITDYQLQTAFLSFEQMGAFVDMCFMGVENSLELALEEYSRMATANFIAEKIYGQTQEATQNGIHVIYVLQQYNSDNGTSLTAAQAMHNLDFFKYTTRLINLYRIRMESMSKLFNFYGEAHFTPTADMRVTVLADFATAVDSYLQSDTYHNELTALPNYYRVPYWQGSGQEYGWSETSTINVTTSDGNVVEQDGVICLLSDIEAIGMTYDNRRVTTTPHNADGEYTNYFYKADIEYFNDMGEQGLVFVLTDKPFGTSEPTE